MDNVKHLMLLAYLQDSQQMKLPPEEGEAVLQISAVFQQRLHSLAGRMPFDSEPAGYVRALRGLREDS